MFLENLGHLPLAIGWATVPCAALILTAGKDRADAKAERKRLLREDFWDGQHEGATEASWLFGTLGEEEEQPTDTYRQVRRADPRADPFDQYEEE